MIFIFQFSRRESASRQKSTYDQFSTLRDEGMRETFNRLVRSFEDPPVKLSNLDEKYCSEMSPVYLN